MLEQKQLSLFGDKPKYRIVSTAEKRSLLEEAGESWPVCDCCGIEKQWNASTSQKAGGTWALRCSVLALVHRNAKTPGTYRYNAGHGIGEAGAKARESKRRLRHTPGTYSYNADHGIGEPGAKARARKRRLSNTPGTYAYSQKIKAIDQRMQKYIDGTPENIEYLERVKSTWI